MLGRLAGTIIGNAIDRRDGRGGLRGAALGYIAGGVIRRLGPLGLLIGGAYLAKRAVDSRRENPA